MPVVDVMMGRANQVPYDQQSDMSEIQRRNLLIQQMMKQATQPLDPTIDAGVIKIPNYAGAIGQILQSVIGAKGAESAAEEQAKVAATTQRIGAEEAKRYMDVKYGGQPEGAGPGGEMVTSKPMPSQAITEGLGARTQFVREMARKAQEERDKAEAAGAVQPLDVLKNAHNYDPNTLPPAWRVMMAGTQLPPTRGVQNDMAYELSHGPTGEPSLFKTPVQTYKDVQPATAGMPPVQYAGGTNEAKGFQGGAQLPENIANQADINERVKIIAAGREKAIGAIGTLQANAAAKELIAQMPQESLARAANLVTTYNTLLLQLGAKPMPENTTKEELASVLAKNVRDHLRLYAPVSNSDADQLRKDLGSLINSKAGAERMLDFVDQQMLPVFIAHNKMLESASKQSYAKDWKEVYGVNPADYGLDMPKLIDRRANPPQQTLTGTAAMEAMPADARERITQETEANPNIPRDVKYSPAPITRFPGGGKKPTIEELKKLYLR